MTKKQLLLLTNTYPDFESSYRGTFIKKMAELLRDEGYEISVVTPKIYRKSAYFEEQNGTKIYRFPFFSGNRMLIERAKIPYLRMIAYYMSGFVLGTYVILKNHCRLIHVHWAIPTGPIGMAAGWLFRKPVVVTVHGSDLRMALSGPSVLKRIFVCVCHGAGHVHVVSEVMKNVVEGLGIPRERISTWPMGVDDVFLQAGENRKTNWNGLPVTILSDRNLLPIYDVSCLIRAVPMILKEEPEVRFLIAGDGTDRERLEREAQHLGVRPSVQFLGRVPHKDMPNLLIHADIYVSTSLSDGTSVSLLEAFASGLFPVVTDIPSNREWIKDGQNGFLVPVGNERKLADRIIEAIRNGELLEKAGKINREIVNKKAYWKTNIHNMVEIYENSLRAG